MGTRFGVYVERMKGKWGAFPLVKQRDQMDCGPACLRMLLRYYGMPLPSSGELSRLCQASRLGVSVPQLIQAAESLGFRVEAFKTEGKDLFQVEEPVVLLWNTGHFVVRYAGKEVAHRIADPAVGKMQLSEDELSALWFVQGEQTGLCLRMLPPARPASSKPRAEENVPFWRSFEMYIPLFRLPLIWLLFCFLSSGFFAMLLPVLFQVVVDVAVVQKEVSILWVLVFAQLFLYIGQLSSQIVRTWMVLGMGAYVNLDRISHFFDQLVHVKWPFFANRMLGDIMLRVDDHKRIERFLLGPAMEMGMSLIQLFFLSLVLLRSSLVAFGMVALSAGFYFFWYRRFVRKRAYMDYELFRREAEHRSQMVEMLEGMQEIKLSGSGRLRIHKWKELRRASFFTQVKAMRLEQRQNVGMVLVGIARDVGITAWTAHLAMEGTISIGVLFSIQFVVGQMGEPIRQWMDTARQAQDASLSHARIQDVYEAEKEPGVLSTNAREQGGPNLQVQTLEQATTVSLSEVCFHYPGLHSEEVVHRVSLDLDAGLYAIVGESGCGKTSLLKLLLGLYEPVSGAIRINGRDLGTLDLSAWRATCGVVLQDSYVFSDTIRVNVAPSDPFPCSETVQKVLEVCCLWEWVKTQPKGMETRVGKEGMGLSQGQRQRLLLARALYRNPKVLLLDEATNALDVQTEHVLWKNLQAFFAQTTTLVVAHRLSTVVRAKAIFVMRGGRIVESGTHASLLARQSYYYELVKHQLYE